MENCGIPAFDAEGAHMRKARFTETQIVAILKDQDAGVPTAELARRHGIHPNTLRTWRARYGGMESSDIARLKQLEEDNTRLRRIVTDLTLDVDALKNVLAKNYPGPRSGKTR
jgi:putative transposase